MFNEATGPPGAPRPPLRSDRTDAGDIEPPALPPEAEGGLGTREAAHRHGGGLRVSSDRALAPRGLEPAARRDPETSGARGPTRRPPTRPPRGAVDRRAEDTRAPCEIEALGPRAGLGCFHCPGSLAAPPDQR